MKALCITVLVAMLIGGTAIDVFGQLGGLDPTFAGGGIFPFKTIEATGLANGVAIQADGKIVFSSSATSAILGWEPGYRMVVARLTEGGLLDNTFGGGYGYVAPMIVGTASIYEPVVAIQPDQKILCGGWTVPLGGEKGDFILTRLHPDGTQDSSFLSVPVDIASHDITESIALLPDGSIIQVGFSYQQFPDLSSSSVTAVKYLPNGALDPSFSLDGKATYYFPSLPNWVGHAVAVQPDGKMVIAGYGYNAADTTYKLLAMRILANGALDPSFSAPDGWYLLDGFTGYTNPSAFSVAIQGDGKIILAGVALKVPSTTDYDALVVRLLPDGSPDFVFGPPTLYGMAPYDFGGIEAIRGIAIDENGHYILAGRSITASSSSRNALVACVDNIYGDVVSGFGVSGPGYTLVNGYNNLFHAVAIDHDNRIVVAGDEVNAAGNVIKVARFSNFVDVFTPDPAAIPLSVFPNPLEAVLHLQYMAPDAGDVRYQVFDVTGTLVWERVEKDQAAGLRQVELHLNSQVPPGLYWLQVQMGQTSGITKIIKQ
ncbi:MAG TPA: hypothetical protein DCF33_08590 [Saprospirales bacterium]|nr:hypothetical protein [Saprospirales bacterium]